MNNFFIRLFAGLIYISVITFSILYDQTSFIIVSSILFFLSIYESNILWLKIPKKEGFNIYPIAQLSIFISYFFFISIPYGGWIYNEVYNPFSILFIFILIWITDTMSYVIGVLFGKNKIDKKYLQISHGKASLVVFYFQFFLALSHLIIYRRYTPYGKQSHLA